MVHIGGGHAPVLVRNVEITRKHVGKRFVVTGGAGGAGKATAELLLKQGAVVTISDIRVDALTAALKDITATGGTAYSVVTNVGDQESVRSAMAEAELLMGGIDGLVNCAAIVRHSDPLDESWKNWSDTFNINVFGAYEAASCAAKSMIANNVRGAIVNVASEAGKVGHKESIAYSASKAALISVTRMLSSALAGNDINVNCVCPGGMATNMLREVAVHYSPLMGQSEDDVFKQLISSQLNRHIEPIEVAHTISFLLSDEAIIIRGQAVNTDGGDTPY